MSDTNEEIQDLVSTEEEIEEAKSEVISEIEQEEIEASKNVKWYIKLRNLFCRTVKAIALIACAYLKAEVVYILNNPNNQLLAKIAVRTAWKLGLKSNEAWAAAWKVLIDGDIFITDGISVKGSQLPTNILETLLQLVYTCLKSSNLSENQKA